MNRKTKGIVLGVATVAAIGAGAGVAVGAGGDDDGAEAPITGESLEKATAAALDFTGEGEVTETEVGDEESYYEVEVTLPSGEETDVQLDKGFNIVSSESDAVDDD
ncbi:MAG: PepSY domain-containing protein [Nocardioidaceae bacterium]|nr:PepSY domain-containing protein [Nocardioidaceae bacterium]